LEEISMVGVRWVAIWAAFALLALPSLSLAEHHEANEEVVEQGCGKAAGQACGKAAGCDCATAGYDCAKGADHKCGDAATCTCGKHACGKAAEHRCGRAAEAFDAPGGAGI
jgi:hypothetical protein